MTSSAFGPAAAHDGKQTPGREIIMSDMDRREFVGAAAVGGVAAAVLAASSAMAAGQTGYFVIAEIVSKKDKADDLRALLVPFAEKSAKEPGCLVYTLMEVISEPGRFLTFEPLDRQGCPRGPHGHAGDQGNRAKARARSRKAVHSAFPRRANGRLSRRPAEYHPTAGRCFRSGPE
jgi:Antibiotic biosynthesis monooxygenase